MKRNLFVIGCMIIGLFVSAQTVTATAQYDYELAYGYDSQDAGYRNAVDMDDWLERGHASVAESPLFPEGIRLTARAAEQEGNYEPGLASAIYYFTVPPWAHYLTINIRYKDAARDDEIAARLWIKGTENDMRGNQGADEEALFYGDTFVLRSGQLSETITIPSNRHVQNGRIEMHIVVDGIDSIDVRDIGVQYLDAQPQITIVHRPMNDYWDQWPRYRYAYHYYYWGPFFWPKSYGAYECWDLPVQFYWVAWRPWFYGFITRFRLDAWWQPRRYTVIYHQDLRYPLAERRLLLRKHLTERHENTTPVTHVAPVTRETAHSSPQTNQPQNQAIYLKKKDGTPPIAKTTVSQNQTQRNQNEQPARHNEKGATIIPNTQFTAVKRQQEVVNKPDPRPRPASPPHETAGITKKDQVQPQKAAPQPLPRTVSKKAAQTPAPTHTPQSNGVRQEQKAQNPATIGQVATPQPPPETRQTQSHNDEARLRPQSAGLQPRSGPVTPEAAQTPRGDRVRQELKTQSPAAIGQVSRQENRQPRSSGGRTAAPGKQ